MGLDRHGRIEAGDAADLVLMRARSLTELLAPPADRPHRASSPAARSTRRLPDYRELDALDEASIWTHE